MGPRRFYDRGGGVSYRRLVSCTVVVVVHRGRLFRTSTRDAKDGKDRSITRIARTKHTASPRRKNPVVVESGVETLRPSSTPQKTRRYIRILCEKISSYILTNRISSS